MSEAQPIKQEFPKELKETFLNTRHACPKCETRFELKETKPDGKKSRSWVRGVLTWGEKSPRAVECFIIKCPSCSQPTQAVIISLVEKLVEEAPVNPPPTTNGATPPAKSVFTPMVKK